MMGGEKKGSLLKKVILCVVAAPFIGALLLYLLFFVLYGVETSRDKNLTDVQPYLPVMEKELGIELDGGEMIYGYDGHGGFHGDGTACIVLSFSEDAVLEQIEKNTAWRPLPLNETAHILCYGITTQTENGTVSRGPYLTDGHREPYLPPIEKGYYLLLDRQPEAYKQWGENMLDRPSLNFTLAIFDTETNRLYYCAMDT